jgi:ferric-dicitrate binding protein FerR (iron transport regulator)
MMNEVHDMDFSPEEIRARAAVRSLSQPVADPTFRDRLRESFATGAIDTRPAPRETVRRSAPAPITRWRRFVPLAAAAAAAAVVFLVAGPVLRDPGLNITAVHGANQIVLNGKLVSCDDLSPLQAALHPGCRVKIPAGAMVEVVGEGQLVMDLEGVEFTFPQPAYRWSGGELKSVIEGDGVVRMATGPGFKGSTYRLRLGDAELLVRDTVFTMTRNGGEIGINVLEGELEARLPDGTFKMVGPGSGTMIKGGSFHPMDFDAAEGDRLRALRERAIVI